MESKKTLIWSITAALAGLLFGFDTVVISGAEKTLQTLWSSSPAFHGFVVISSALWGTVIGALFGGIPTNKWGRKNTLIIIGVLYIVSALGSALTSDPYIFAIFRFIGGLGVGTSTIAAPIYISEIAPPKKRGRLVGLYQFNIVAGILIAYLSNYMFRDFGENSWRWMLGIEALPALIYTILTFFIPKSKRWLAMKNNGLSGVETVKDSIFKKKYMYPLVLAFFIAFFNQFSGINAFLYYAPRIFEASGLDKSGALLSGVGLGFVNLVFTLIGIVLIDKLGRKQLMYIGSIGYIISLSAVSSAFIFHWEGLWVPLSLFLFIAAHAIGQGTVIWVFISEIFPNHLRGSGQAFGSSVHWILAALIPAFIPQLFDTIGAGSVFAIFTFMMVLQLIFVYYMPETRGIPLEELSKKLQK